MTQQNPSFLQRQIKPIITMGLVSIVINLLFLTLYIQQKKEIEVQEFKRKNFEKLRAQIVADSLIVVNKNKLIYNNMIRFISIRDSVRKTLRYQIGDIVYLKPDSISCVIMDVASDSTLSTYNYILLSNNKNNDPGILIRHDKLLY